MNLLCLASYEKGHDFLREAKQQGAHVRLLTSLSLKDQAAWPNDAIDEILYMPDDQHTWNREHTFNAVSYLARSRSIDRIVALDDFDVELAASLREHLRLPGIGESQVRYFRDKLAMRQGARAAQIPVPDFTGVFNYDELRDFMARVPQPWLLKPRSLAGAIGIKKLYSPEEVWSQLNALGDMQSHYLLECYVPGNVYHVDTILYGGKVLFASPSAYGRPPMDVSHGGGVFSTRTLGSDEPDYG